MAANFEIVANNANAPFTLKLHRGDGMTLLAMNWRKGKPPRSFVGFTIEYKEPKGKKFWSIKNRINFADVDGSVSTDRRPSRDSPIQKFRWVHFPVNAEIEGLFTYRVTPVFMDAAGVLSYGEKQQARIALARETHPKKLNVAFTRGFVTSQAFVKKFGENSLDQLMPGVAKKGLDFRPTHPDAENALKWMGFEARRAILDLLDDAINDTSAKVYVVCYDLNDPAIVARFEKLRDRLYVIIDDSKEHKEADTAESKAAKRLTRSAGVGHVKRQHMSGLQHNKTIVVDGRKIKAALFGSTNFTWRGQFIQSNNVMVVRGKAAIKPFKEAFDHYWETESVKDFGLTDSTNWHSLGFANIDASVTFSPHSKNSSALQAVGDDIASAKSSVFYSLAFLNQTGGAVTDAIVKVTESEDIFVYGISDKNAKNLNLQLPNGKIAPVYVKNLGKNSALPFLAEPTGLGANNQGTRMHHKFVVIDFDKPTARVYMGSYNFSAAADNKNGENLVLIKDRRVAVSYMIQALTLFDHYHFRVAQSEAEKRGGALKLRRAPKRGESPWWEDYYSDERKIRDRKLFS